MNEAAKTFKGSVTPASDHLVFTWGFKKSLDNGEDRSESLSQYVNHSVGFVRSAFATDSTLTYVKTIAQLEDENNKPVLSHVWFREKVNSVDWSQIKNKPVIQLMSKVIDSAWADEYHKTGATTLGLFRKNIHLLDIPKPPAILRQ